MLLNILPAGAVTIFDAICLPPAHYHEISETETALFTVVISLTATSEITSEIKNVIETEPPEDRPMEAVSQSAIEMIKAADKHSLVYLTASEIESFEGSLLVHWTVQNKRVTLISSGPDGHVKLYKKGPSNLSELIPNPSPGDLSTALNWVMQ